MMHWTDQYYGNRVGDAKSVRAQLTAMLQKAQANVNLEKSATGEGTILYGYAGRLWNALKEARIPEPAIKFAFILCYMESGAFTNTLTRKDNNPASMMWYQGAQRGTYVAANKTYAAHYNSVAQFAQHFRVELSKGARPIDAGTLEDFVHRLKLNGYMGKESEVSYLNKMRGAAQRLRIQSSLQDDANQKIVMPNKKKLPVWAWVAIGVGTVVLVRGISK